MPCSRCYLAGHNARNRRCPALYRTPANNIFAQEVAAVPVSPVQQPAVDLPVPSVSMPVHPAQQPAVEPPTPALTRLVRRQAQIRPRGYVSRRRRPSYALLEFLATFQNFRMSHRWVISQDEPVYHSYELPRNLMEIPQVNQGILRHFIHPMTRTVQICPINRDDITGLAIATPNGGIRILSNEPYPINEPVYLVIPQLPGITIRDEEEEAWLASVNTAVNAIANAVPNVPRRRIASSYVKEWQITLDVSSSTGDKLDDVCMVCLDEKPATRFAKTNCGHEYCVDCVKAHVNANKFNTTQIACPMCRTDLSEIVLCDVDTHSDLQEFILVV